MAIVQTESENGMTGYQFQQEFIAALYAGKKSADLYALVVKFKSAGGDQQTACDVLMNIRSIVAEKYEDRILDILDFVTGFCSAHARIWPSPLHARK